MKKKLFSKRFRLTKKGKIIRRASGLGHNLAKKSSKKTRKSRKTITFIPKKLLKQIKR